MVELDEVRNMSPRWIDIDPPSMEGVLFHTSSPHILVSIEVLHLCISITLYSIMADTKGTFLVEESQSQSSCLIAAAEHSFDSDPREIVWGNLLL